MYCRDHSIQYLPIAMSPRCKSAQKPVRQQRPGQNRNTRTRVQLLGGGTFRVHSTQLAEVAALAVGGN